jgi:hypothetical protein
VRGKSWHPVQEEGGRRKGRHLINPFLPSRVTAILLSIVGGDGPSTRFSSKARTRNHSRRCLEGASFLFASPFSPTPFSLFSRSLSGIGFIFFRPDLDALSPPLNPAQNSMSAQNHQLDSAAPAPTAQPAATNNTTLPSASTGDDTLLCKWKQCGERADSAESLFVSPVV